MSQCKQNLSQTTHCYHGTENLEILTEHVGLWWAYPILAPLWRCGDYGHSMFSKCEVGWSVDRSSVGRSLVDIVILTRIS